MKTGFKWENDKTKLNATNLNKLNNAIDTNSDALQVLGGRVSSVENEIGTLESTTNATFYGTCTTDANTGTKVVSLTDNSAKVGLGDTICIRFTKGSTTGSVIGPQTMTINGVNFLIGGFDCEANQQVIFASTTLNTLTLEYAIPIIHTGASTCNIVDSNFEDVATAECRWIKYQGTAVVTIDILTMPTTSYTGIELPEELQGFNTTKAQRGQFIGSTTGQQKIHVCETNITATEPNKYLRFLDSSMTMSYTMPAYTFGVVNITLSYD